MKRYIPILSIALWFQACTPTPPPASNNAAQPTPAGSAASPTPMAIAPKPPADPPPPPEFVLPAGSTLKVRTASSISTKTAKAGDRIAASLAEPLVVDGRVIAPRGANAVLRVVDSDKGGRIKETAHLSVRLAQVTLASGKTVDVQTNAIGRTAPKTVKRDATKVAIASGVGAAIGAIAGQGRGAAIGAGAGAAAGTGVVLATHGKPAVIAAESLLTFSLQSSVKL